MSLKGPRYETVEEAQRRLGQTVVLYEGAPVFITRVTANRREEDGTDDIFRVHCIPLPVDLRTWEPGARHPLEIRKYISSKNFEFAPFEMGYANLSSTVAYTARVSARQNQQGLSRHTLTIQNIEGNAIPAINFSGILREKGFVDCIFGKYDDFQTCLDKLHSNEFEAVAACRKVAVSFDTDIDLGICHYKGRSVGLVVDGRSVKLSKKFHYLKEEFEENRIQLS